MKINVALTCVAIVGLSGCGSKPDLTAIKAELDQIQHRQMLMWTNNYYLWNEVEAIRTNTARLPDEATINAIAYFYHTNQLDDTAARFGSIATAVSGNRQAMSTKSDMILVKLKEVEDGQSFDRKAESNFDLKIADALNDIDTNAIDASFKLNLIKIRLGIP